MMSKRIKYNMPPVTAISIQLDRLMDELKAANQTTNVFEIVRLHEKIDKLQDALIEIAKTKK